MIVLILACLLLASACTLAMVCRPYRRQLIGLGGATALLWVWLNACGAFNALYMRTLVPAPWFVRLAATAISPAEPLTLVLLGGGTERTGPGRIPRPAGDSIEKIALTAAIYHQAIISGRAAEVVVSGGDPQKHGVAEADNYTPDLILLGIPANAVVKEVRSLNTIQNARYVAAILAKRHPPADASRATGFSRPAGMERQLVLITTAIHMRRALLDFERQGLHPIPLAPPVHTLHQGFWPTVLRFDQANAELHELIGIAQFFVYRQLGWY
jgi:uncharacterized SAM-binding protein YcdF (DUF218 family)